MMVITTSEYQRAFMPKYDAYASTYAANLGFRNVKRRTESSHDTNPFEWYPGIDDTDEELIAQKRPASVPLHIYKHMLYNKAYLQRHSTDKNKSALESETDQKISAPAEESDQEKSTKEGEPNINEKDFEAAVSGKQTLCKDDTTEHKENSSVPLEELVKLDLKEISDKKDLPQSDKPDKAELPHADSHYIARKPRPKRPKRPGNTKPLPKARPSTGPAVRSRMSPRISSDTDKAPFVPYGYEDKEIKTCLKMTHNVRASSQIYPAALKASHRRRCELEDKERKRKVLSATVPKRNYFDVKMAKETSEWETEYRHCYAAHAEKVYKANLSARTLPRAASA